MSLEQTRLEKKFIKYHQKNPEVWSEFKRYAFEAIEAGRTQYSAKLIIEKIRWDSKLEVQKVSAFKIPNEITAYYARLFHRTFLAYRGFFKTLGGEFESGIQDQKEETLQTELAL